MQHKERDLLVYYYIGSPTDDFVRVEPELLKATWTKVMMGKPGRVYKSEPKEKPELQSGWWIFHLVPVLTLRESY